MDLILIELILVMTVALGLGAWQLYDVNKEIKKDEAEDAQGTPGKDKPGKDKDKSSRASE